MAGRAAVVLHLVSGPIGSSQLVVLVVGLLVIGALVLVVWERLSPSRRTRRRRGSARTARPRASVRGAPPETARPRVPAPSATAPVERPPAILDWPAHEATVRTLLRQRDYREARRQIAAALSHAGITDERRTVFEELQGDAVGAEIGQMTAAAVRDSQQGEGPGVLASLEQAAALLDEAGTALPGDRREEIKRRLSLAYTKVGTHRLEARRFTDAADALVRALQFAGDDAGRRAESCGALARALRQLAEVPGGGQADARRFAEALEAAADGNEAPPADTIADIRALLATQPRGA